jgi:hypothetical protein
MEKPVSNVIQLRDAKIAVEAKAELDDAIDSLTQAVKLLKMAGQDKISMRVSAHMHALYALRLMMK